MKSFNITQTPDINSPLQVYGLAPYFDNEGFIKCHKAISDKIKRIEMFAHRSNGGRICFRTNARRFNLSMTLEKVSVDIGIPIYGASAANVYAGMRPVARFIGPLSPIEYSDKPVFVEATFDKGNDRMEDITVFLPRNGTITDFGLTVEDDCDVEMPTPYRNKRPVVFYGSSITEGGCPTRVGCNYVSILSNRLNIDIRNYGFSGNAMGDLNFADYIIAQNPCVIVYDYDHNAPSAEHLENTHKAFFERMRNALPDVPIIMMSMPDFTRGEGAEIRRKIIKKTYDDAVAAGDSIVSFIDGGTYFPPRYREYCTVDTIHPNDMGFAFMADAVESELSAYMDYIK